MEFTEPQRAAAATVVIRCSVKADTYFLQPANCCDFPDPTTRAFLGAKQQPATSCTDPTAVRREHSKEGGPLHTGPQEFHF
jgi:hypothetical protein